MKIGEIWQIILGNYYDYNDLGIGHESGLDIVSYKHKIAIELKNRTNTDNASSKKSNLDKLANFKIKNPDYTCIYGTINEKTKNGSIKTILHNNVEIKHYSGLSLVKFILGDNTDNIIKFTKNLIDEYLL